MMRSPRIWLVMGAINVVQIILATAQALASTALWWAVVAVFAACLCVNIAGYRRARAVRS